MHPTNPANPISPIRLYDSAHEEQPQKKNYSKGHSEITYTGGDFGVAIIFLSIIILGTIISIKENAWFRDGKK